MTNCSSILTSFYYWRNNNNNYSLCAIPCAYIQMHNASKIPKNKCYGVQMQRLCQYQSFLFLFKYETDRFHASVCVCFKVPYHRRCQKMGIIPPHQNY